ncbi:MAG: hypothetical protein V3T21_06475 [Candidatus Margulisiibacteriota bacterium]
MGKISRLALHWKQIRKKHGRLLGQKPFILVRHLQRGRPIPPLFAIPNSVVAEVLKTGEISQDLKKAIRENTAKLEKETGMKFGGEKNPLTLAVRSGDPRSMYGALLTLPGIGLNDRTYPALIDRCGPESEAEVLWMYLDLIVDFAMHVRGIKKEKIQPLLNEMRGEDKSASELRELIHKAQNMRAYYNIKFNFPQDLDEQIMEAVRAVAFSWKSVKAECAAAALRLGSDELLSVFVQQMAFSSLTSDSGFISLLTNPGPEGSYAPKTSGRRIMFGLAKNVESLPELSEENPELYAKIEKIIDVLVREEKDPLNLEIVIERGEPKIVQITKAALSPVVHVDAINDMVAKGIIFDSDATRKIADVQIEQEIKMYRIEDGAMLELLAQGKPGSPGAMAGKLALTVEQALQFKKQKERVILLSTEPQDENVYLLTLGHNIDGIMATYGIGRGSHIADFSQANGIPMVASLRKIKLLKNAMEIGGKKIKVGDLVVIDGEKGMVYTTKESDPIVEDQTMISHSYNVNFLEILRSIRIRYRTKTYEEILIEHAEGTKYLKDLVMEKASKKTTVGVQARIHCLHRLAYEKGKRLRKNQIAVDLDVAVADGNLDRIPGLEDKGFYFDITGDEYFIIMGTELEYDFDMVQEDGVSIDDVRGVMNAVQDKDLKIEYFYSSRKLTMHRQHVATYGIRFHKDQYDRVVEFLKEYYKTKNGVEK